MKKSLFITKIDSLALFITMFAIPMPIYSCVISLKNDSGAKLVVVDCNDRKAYEINKDKTKKFGDPEKHAKFIVFNKKPKSRSYDFCCTCEQNACAGDRKPQIAYSDLINNTKAVELFTVHKAQ